MERMRYGNKLIAQDDEFVPCHPHPKELELISESGFRCFCCLSRRPKSRFGGIRANQPICTSCYPVTDDQEIVGYVSFDTWHGFL